MLKLQLGVGGFDLIISVKL